MLLSSIAIEPRLARGAAWATLRPQDLNPIAKRKMDRDRLAQINRPRIEKLALLAWPQLSKRFKIGIGYQVNLTTGAWIDHRGVRQGIGIISLVAHLCKASLLETAEILLKVIRVRPRLTDGKRKPQQVKAAPVPETKALVQMVDKPHSSVVTPKWLAPLLPSIGRPAIKYACIAAATYAGMAAAAAIFAATGG